MTRRDQLSIKRAPPSKRKGKGKGRGGKKEKEVAATPKGKKEKKVGATSKAKSKRSKTSRSKRDVEDDEASEIHVEQDEQEPEKKTPKVKAKKARSSKVTTEPASTDDSKPKEPKRKASKGKEPALEIRPPTKKRRETPLFDIVGESLKKIIHFVYNLDMGLELDAFKDNVRRVAGDLGQASLNSYWTKYTCGLRWRTGRTVKDVAHFSFAGSQHPGSQALKRAVAIGTAVEMVTRFLLGFSWSNMSSLPMALSRLSFSGLIKY